MLQEKTFYKAEDIAEILDLNIMTIYRYIKSGKLIAYKFGKEYRITETEFNTFLNLCSTEKDIKASKSETNQPTAIGLFAGCGGLDLGFKRKGFNILYANDNDKSVKDTYERNIGPIDINDITKIDKNSLPSSDVILAGIPCQPFSSAGNRGSVTDDRGILFKQVVDIVKIKSPKIVLFENVRGFLSAKDDTGMKMPERMTLEMNKLGYNLYYKLLNAADYGVPQNRYRVVMVCIRSDLDRGFTFPEPLDSKDKIKISNVIEKPLPNDEEQEVWNLSPQSMSIIEYIPAGGSWKDVPYEALPPRLKKIRDNIKKYKSPNFYRRFSPDEVMGTVTAASTPENSGILHPLENRRYSVREIARFQSFPETFKFVGATTAQKYKMIGNAVPVSLAEKVAEALIKQYFSNYENHV